MNFEWQEVALKQTPEADLCLRGGARPLLGLLHLFEHAGDARGVLHPVAVCLVPNCEMCREGEEDFW